jgi:hypothetical protein
VAAIQGARAKYAFEYPRVSWGSAISEKSLPTEKSPHIEGLGITWLINIHHFVASQASQEMSEILTSFRLAEPYLVIYICKEIAADV